MSQYNPFDLKINVGHCDLHFMVQWFFLISWLFDVWTSLFGIMNQYDLMFDLKINIGHCGLYFMVQWFCFTSWRLTIWCMNIILRDFGSVWPEVWPQNHVCHCDLYFMVQWFFSYISKTIWLMSVIFSDNELRPLNKHRSWSSDFAQFLQDYLMNEHHSWYHGSVWHKDWPHQQYVCQWPIFYGPVILHHILPTWDNGSVSTKVNKKYMWVSDLYFMVQ